MPDKNEDNPVSKLYGRWSPLRRCCACNAGPLLTWMVIDEDEAAYGGYTNQGHCGCYEQEDTEKLEALYAEYPLLRNTTVCYRVKPSAAWSVHATPPGVQLRDWDRPPSLDQIKSDFLSDIERFKNLNEKIYFYTIVDNSGSMTTSTVQPGWNQFLDWLAKEFSEEDDRFVNVHTLSSGFPERWILFIQNEMKKYIDELKVKPQEETLTMAMASLAMKSENMTVESNGPEIPGTHDLTRWRQYTGPYCRWMQDTGIAAVGNCNSHVVECLNPACPISGPLANGQKTYWKTRLCNPENCQFFEW